jgi:menaquinone-9 beta-reductase
MKKPVDCDIAVVGAGPAGATAACLLAGSGFDVRLFDKQAFPRPKLCAGLLTWKSVDLLKRIFNTGPPELFARGVITHACRDYRIHVGQREIARGRLDFPFHFVDRTRYDHHWVEAARTAGARVYTQVAVTHIDPMHGGLTLDNGSNVRCRYIIGADGVWSKVRGALHAQKQRERRWRDHLAVTIETHHPLPENGPSFAGLHFGLIPWGYAWSFPGERHQTIGMAALPQKRNQSIKRTFDNFLVAHKMDMQPNMRRSYPLPYGNFLTTPAKQNALVVGDACGLADPLLGEGIYYAHRSAQIAAQAIIDAGFHFERVAAAYTRNLNRSVIRELRWIKFFRDMLFIGGTHRRFRGLSLFFRLIPKRLEAAVQGHRPFSKLLFP